MKMERFHARVGLARVPPLTFRTISHERGWCSAPTLDLFRLPPALNVVLINLCQDVIHIVSYIP